MDNQIKQKQVREESKWLTQIKKEQTEKTEKEDKQKAVRRARLAALFQDDSSD